MSLRWHFLYVLRYSVAGFGEGVVLLFILFYNKVKLIYILFFF